MQSGVSNIWRILWLAFPRDIPCGYTGLLISSVMRRGQQSRVIRAAGGGGVISLVKSNEVSMQIENYWGTYNTVNISTTDIKLKGCAYMLEMDMGLAGNVINDVPDVLVPAATDEVLLRCSMLGEKQWKCIISNPLMIDRKMSLMIPQSFTHTTIFQAPTQQ